MQITSLPKHVTASDIAPERLANNSALTEQQKIAEASRQFEAILLRQILSATQKPVISSKFADNSTASQIYREMVTDQLADSVSKSGALGLAKTFEKQLTRSDGLAHKQGANPPSGGPALHTPGFQSGIAWPPKPTGREGTQPDLSRVHMISQHPHE